MSRDQFNLILSYFNLCNNVDNQPQDSPDYNPLFKIRKFVDALNENFQRTFHPGKDIAIDEAMVAWRGNLSFFVYNPDKPDKFGIKVFQLCDGQTGYCSNLEFYTGKAAPSAKGATFDVAERLIRPYLNCGRTLYVDNYYISPDLFTYLKEQRTLACGTMRINRKNGPPKTMIPKLKKTEKEAVALTNGVITLLQFFDKREVNVLTTAHDNSVVDTGKVNRSTGDPIIKLHAVNEYNKLMGAVDRSDQMV
ncbi:piggyBac transposable element-derived protein 4, partial [Aplysia californica]|uniref:PiggyBac transposable element-derived protein 4 n=1 Tax=Aplysia californica TaxID=6500 RepID=A0ABM1A0U0_APLCA